eukprot:CAMPEP_0183330538 /NCGR_PEP_ID=MMETSP0160_2-20130417/85354_1 /TAXON_ID=2839 ORGANISM="Odontella Sinensis, Strain Grunow 1884" /NCGR_SAMPLE_ID=MMETSP0160_2 /ASSEMBLY_ACC=CAM_ASM_000250 /LENGTH=130 /DNA_ID=CAMNT_0025498747 /DNA_START=443 /DNA_END=835 /DNA_ORIENTATION=+
MNLFRIAALVMAAALLLSATAGPNTSLIRLVITIAFVAMAYGSNWVLIVQILSEKFGREHFGKDYGVIALGPALSSLIFNSASARIYEDHIDTGDSSICIGTTCYHTSFLFTAFAAVSGIILSFFIGRGR